MFFLGNMQAITVYIGLKSLKWYSSQDAAPIAFLLTIFLYNL